MTIRLSTNQLLAMQEQSVRLQNEMLDAHGALTGVLVQATDFVQGVSLSGLEMVAVIHGLTRQTDRADAILRFGVNAMRGLRLAVVPETTGAYRHLSRTIRYARQMIALLSREAATIVRNEGGLGVFERVARNSDQD